MLSTDIADDKQEFQMIHSYIENIYLKYFNTMNIFTASESACVYGLIDVKRS